MVKNMQKPWYKIPGRHNLTIVMTDEFYDDTFYQYIPEKKRLEGPYNIHVYQTYDWIVEMHHHERDHTADYSIVIDRIVEREKARKARELQVNCAISPIKKRRRKKK